MAITYLHNLPASTVRSQPVRFSVRRSLALLQVQALYECFMVLPIHIPSARHGRYYVFPLICTLIATPFLLLTALSAPFIGSLYFFEASYNFRDTTVPIVFGVFGFCWKHHGMLFCSQPKIGYQLGL